MSTGTESADAIAWVVQQLNADSQFVAAVPGSVHIGVAPQGTADPVCVLFVQSAPEYLTAFGQRIFTDVTVMVKISGRQDNYPTLQRTAAQRAYAALQRKTGGAQGAIIISCIMQNSFPSPEPALVNGVQWMSHIQLYQVLVQ